MTEFGTALWSSPAWQASAVEWIDDRLALAGIRRTGDVEQPHVRAWATALRIPTDHGPYWLKACGPGTAFEVRLYGVLTELAPAYVLPPVAADPSRGAILLPDGGRLLGDQLSGPALGRALGAAMVRYGSLQRARPRVQRWCAQLTGSALPASLDHNDLHPRNIFWADGSVRFFDWGDAVVAHPFAAMLVPLGLVRQLLGEPAGGPQFAGIRDGYLDPFRALAPGEDLPATLTIG